MNWFYQQNRRDQLVLIIGGLCVSLALIWTLVIQPLNEATKISAQRIDSTAATLARVKSLAANLQYFESQQRGRTQSAQISMIGIIDQSSRIAGLNFSSVNPSANGDQATVRFNNAELANMLQWLYELENRHQAQIEDLRLNGATQSGYVSGSVRIRKQR